MDDAPQPNPYRTDKPRTVGDVRRAQAGKRPMGLLIAAGLEAWTAAYTAVTAPSTLERYREMFAGFGAQLPVATRALFDMPWLWYPYALIGIALLVWIGVRAQPTDVERRHMRRALWLFGIAFGVMIAWAAYALWVPIFRLGAVV
jgi:hypothetical protein